MPDIKTRDVVRGSIKTLDRSALAGQRMKQAYIRTKERAAETAQPAQASPEEYASDRITGSVEVASHEGVHQLDNAGHRAVAAVKEHRQERRQREAQQEANQPKTRSSVQAEYSSPSVQSPEAAQENFRHRRQVEQLRRQTQAGKAPGKNTPTPTAPSEAVPPSSPISAPAPASSPGKAAPSASPIRGSSNIRGRPISRRSATRTAEQTERTAARTVTASGRVVKTKAERYTVKTADRSVKAGIKTAEQTAKITQRSAQAAARTAQVTAHTARVAAQKAAVTAKAAAKAVISSVRAIIAATKTLITTLAAGGSVAFLIVVVICLIGLLVGSVFGIFFSGEDTGSGLTMRSAIREINQDYQDRLDGIQNTIAHDELEMSGSRATWPEVLAVYAVKTNTDPTDGQEVASMTERKRDILENIFWEMNVISYNTATASHVETTSGTDENGNPIEIQTTVETVTLYITVTHKTPEEMADQFHFDADQREKMEDLLSDEYRTLWNTVLFGIGIGDDDIVAVALSQVGNVGGQPYWSWYGFPSRVEWCACFVSWCAEQCGYIEAGIIPKFAGCPTGEQWFKDRGQWADRNYLPNPGDIIFLDWASDGIDGLADHVGIVERCEGGVVYTVEGNMTNSCKQRQYTVGYYEICGYGVPAY